MGKAKNVVQQSGTDLCSRQLQKPKLPKFCTILQSAPEFKRAGYFRNDLRAYNITKITKEFNWKNAWRERCLRTTKSLTGTDPGTRTSEHSFEYDDINIILIW